MVISFFKNKNHTPPKVQREGVPHPYGTWNIPIGAPSDPLESDQPPKGGKVPTPKGVLQCLWNLLVFWPSCVTLIRRNLSGNRTWLILCLSPLTLYWLVLAWNLTLVSQCSAFIFVKSGNSSLWVCFIGLDLKVRCTAITPPWTQDSSQFYNGLDGSLVFPWWSSCIQHHKQFPFCIL